MVFLLLIQDLLVELGVQEVFHFGVVGGHLLRGRKLILEVVLMLSR